MTPDLTEIEATVQRMETRYRNDPLFGTYEQLCEQFATDLADPRDLALSKAAALMLIKFAAAAAKSSPP